MRGLFVSGLQRFGSTTSIPSVRFRKTAMLLLSLSVLSAPVATHMAAQEKKAEFASLPIVFEPNAGQAPNRYQFVTRHDGMQVMYVANGMDLYVPQSPSSMARVGLRFVGTRPGTVVYGEKRCRVIDIFRGSDPAKWLRKVPQYSQVRYSRIYEGIDLVFHGMGAELEHDFVLDARADPSEIAFRLDRRMRLTSTGDLEVVFGSSHIRFQKPIAYQESASGSRNVRADFLLARDGTVRFKLGKYDHSQRLIIDPVFGFSTYLAGSSVDQIKAVTTDPTGKFT